MKEILKNLKSGAIIAISFIATLIIFGTIYAAVNNIWTNTDNLQASSGSTLTSDAWNKMLSNQNALSGSINSVNTNLNNLTTKVNTLSGTISNLETSGTFGDDGWGYWIVRLPAPNSATYKKTYTHNLNLTPTQILMAQQFSVMKNTVAAVGYPVNTYIQTNLTVQNWNNQIPFAAITSNQAMVSVYNYYGTNVIKNMETAGNDVGAAEIGGSYANFPVYAGFIYPLSTNSNIDSKIDSLNIGETLSGNL